MSERAKSAHTPEPWEWETPDGKAVSFGDDYGEWSSHLDDCEREESASTCTRPIRAGGKVIALVVYAEHGYTPGRIPAGRQRPPHRGMRQRLPRYR